MSGDVIGLFHYAASSLLNAVEGDCQSAKLCVRPWFLLPGSEIPRARPTPHVPSDLAITDLAGESGDTPVAIRVAEVYRARWTDHPAIVQDVARRVSVLHHHVAPSDRY
jgi:hypothetical protein